MKTFDIITIGGASRDVFFMTSGGKVINDLKHNQKLIGFPYGGKLIPEDSKFTYGGGGLNSAISFVKLGLNIATVINVGAEGTGSLVLKDLHNYGVCADFCGRDLVNHTALSIIVSLPGEDHTMFLYRGANDFLKVPDWRLLRTNWFYLTSLTGQSAEIIPELFAYCRAHGIKIAWNPGQEQLRGGYEDLSSFLEETDILILNRAEAESLVRSRKPRAKLDDEKILLNDLQAMTGKLVLVTDGRNGSYASDGKKEYFHASVGSKAVETTGAGDAYGSTFVAFFLMGYGIKYCMKAAAINSGNVVQFIGSQDGLMTFGELESKIDIEKVK